MEIKTQRLILRNYRMADIEDYWDYVQMKNVGPRCGWEPYTDKQKAIERLLLETKKPLQFAIVEAKENKVVGSVELMTRDGMAEDIKEIGCLLSEKYWNKGIMTEAMQAIIKFGFEYLGLKEIYAGYFAPNTASGKVQQKAGMQMCEVKKDFRNWYETNTPCDLIMNKITKQMYLNNPIYENLNICINNETKKEQQNERN